MSNTTNQTAHQHAAPATTETTHNATSHNTTSHTSHSAAQTATQAKTSTGHNAAGHTAAGAPGGGVTGGSARGMTAHPPGAQLHNAAGDAASGGTGRGRGMTAEPVVMQTEPDSVTEPDAATEVPSVAPLIWVLVVSVLMTSVLRKLSRVRWIASVRRSLRVTTALIWLGALILIGLILLQNYPPLWLLGYAGVLAALVMLNMRWLRDVLAGLTLMMEGRIVEGTRVRVGEVEGEVTRLHMRVVQLRTTEGTVLSIPNKRFLTEQVACLDMAGGDARCEVRVVIPRTLTTDEALSLASQAVLLSPLAAPRKRPEVVLIHEPGQRPTIIIRAHAFERACRDRFVSDLTARILGSFHHAEDEHTTPSVIS